jgi:hypothetical protein
LAENPGAVSPGALSRPAIQDAILGTSLFIVGPGELSYLAQAAAVYRTLEVQAPRLALRPQALVLEGHQPAHLQAWGGDLADLLAENADVDRLISRGSGAAIAQPAAARRVGRPRSCAARRSSSIRRSSARTKRPARRSARLRRSRKLGGGGAATGRRARDCFACAPRCARRWLAERVVSASTTPGNTARLSSSSRHGARARPAPTASHRSHEDSPRRRRAGDRPTRTMWSWAAVARWPCWLDRAAGSASCT